MTTLFDSLPALLPELEELYRDLHAHPELAFAEVRTAAVVAERLKDQGWDVTTGVGRTGVVGVLRNGAGPVVMMRADMDALPVLERTGLPYASSVIATDDTGVEVPVMHACGHDMHVAALLGTTALLAAHRPAWAGTAIAVFQPGEECGYGAHAMVEDGLFDRFELPDVILGQHVGPGPSGMVATRPGLLMGATDSVRVTLYGRGGHGSRPEMAVDPVVMAANLVVRLQNVVAREVPAADPVVVTVGTLHAGTTAAVIPDEATLGINIRTSSAPVRERVLAAITRYARAEAEAAGAPREPAVESVYELPMTVNDAGATARVVGAHRAGLGAAAVLPIEPVTASEDFSVLAAARSVPSVYWFFGANDQQSFGRAMAAGRIEQDIPQNHSALFAPIIEPTLATGIRAMAAAALAWLGPDATSAESGD